MSNTKPLVQCACVCETVIFGKDNTASIIRIVDSITAYLAKEQPVGIPAGFPISLFVRLCAGEIKEKGTLSIQATRPDGSKAEGADIPVEWPVNGQGFQAKIEYVVLNPQNGYYWFDVLWNGEVITKTPLQVTLSEAGQAPVAGQKPIPTPA